MSQVETMSQVMSRVETKSQVELIPNSNPSPWRFAIFLLDRLDWNIWFIGFPPHQAYLNRRETWLYTLLAKLLNELDPSHRPWLNLLDTSSAGMLRDNYVQHGKAPTFAKVDMYQYQMAAPLWELLPRFLMHPETTKVSSHGLTRIQWWNRTFQENLIPIVVLGQDQWLMRVRVEE